MSQYDDKSLAMERTEMASERTRLAAERTFSAWIRTGLAGVGGGLAIIHFFVFYNEYHRLAAHWMGQLLILWGISIFIYALYGYHRAIKQLSSTFWPTKIWIMSGIALSLVLFALVFLLISLHL
jgi:putative membrane protein